MKHAIILAAGLGKRMGGKYPKVLTLLQEKTLIETLLDNISGFFSRITVVIGFMGEEVIKRLSGRSESIAFAVQKEQKGTADAVMSALGGIDDGEDIFILSGDVPLLRKKSLEEMCELRDREKADLVLGTIMIEHPDGYGRVIEHHGEVAAIVEEKDADEEQKMVTLVNGGCYLINGGLLKKHIGEIRCENKQKEYYLTDIVAILKKAGRNVRKYLFLRSWELMGVNTPDDLKEVSKYVHAQ